MKEKIKILTFDTGGTILDWHSGFYISLKKIGDKYNLNKDWGKIANKLRKDSMNAMLQLGKKKPPSYNFDNAHRFCLEKILHDEKISEFNEKDINYISYTTPHRFNCWSDFPIAFDKIKKKFIVCSFSILSYRLIMDSSKHNNLVWDAIFSCEGLGKYKMLPEPYKKVVAFLQVQPSECLMVACHPWDLDAAKSAGYRTAFVSRPREWGKEKAPWENEREISKNDYDIIVEDFPSLAYELDV